MIVPVTRKEKLLNAIATNGNVDFSPKTREELFLFKILGADVNAPTPITRKEILYQHIIDGTIPTFEPQTRLEKFIMAAAGAELELPVVLTREEYWWAEISDSAYETITGAIVHFISKRARAIKSLIADISYTQDLHGYANPWLPGGGKNLIPDAENMGESWNEGRAASVSNGVATLEGTDSNYNASITTAKMPKSIFDGTTILTWSIYYKSSSACTITYTFAGFSQSPSQSGHTRTKYRADDLSLPSTNGEWLRYTILSRTIAESDFRSGSGDVNSVGFQIYARSNVTIQIKQEQVEKSASATDFAPYSNICPISGFTGVNVTRTGKNLFDGTFIADTMIVDSTGEYYANAYHKCSNKILAKENTVYTLSGTDLHKRSGTATNAANVTIAYYKVDGTYIRREAPDTSTNTYKTVTTPANTAFVIFQVGGQATNVMLEESATETTYEPYQGNTYSVAFPAVGKNLFNAFDAQPLTTNGVTFYRTNGVYHLSGTNTKTDATWVLDARRIDLPKFEIGKTYTMSVSGNIPSNIYIQLSGANAQTGSQYSMGTVQRTSTQVSFTVDDRYSSTAQLFVGILKTATNVDGEFSIQIEEGSTATAYEPYTTTVYGGTLDVVSGLLTVDRAGVDLGTLTWEVRYTETNNKTIRTNLPLTLPHAQTRKIISENYKYQGTVTTASILQHPDNLDIGLRTYYKKDQLGYDDIVYAVIPVSESPDGLLVYELATPQTYQLTPTEVTALLGDNTIWADTGDVTVTY